MNLNIFIAEDNRDKQDYISKRIRKEAKAEGFNINKETISATFEETEDLLKNTDINYDIIVLDIELQRKGNNIQKREIIPSDLPSFLNFDILSESKVIIYTGNANFYRNADKIRRAIAYGARTVVIKADDDKNSPLSFTNQIRRIIQEIRNETIWANIGRFAPYWKRELFSNKTLWGNLKKGLSEYKVFMLVDISNSTHFVNTQRRISRDDEKILSLFKYFAEDATEIIENESNKGIIERFSGDEFLAYFNTNEDDKCDVLNNAVDVAKELLHRFNCRLDEITKKFRFTDTTDAYGNLKEVGLRILISYGKVIWVLQGTEYRPQLSIMTENVAKLSRAFNHTQNGERTILPNSIYITFDAHSELIDCGMSVNYFDKPTELNGLRNFPNYCIYKLIR